MRWAPMLFLPAPLHSAISRWTETAVLAEKPFTFPSVEPRFTPHYPKNSPLDDLIRYVVPGTDEYVSEKYASEIAQLLDDWAKELRSSPPALSAFGNVLDASFQAARLVPTEQNRVRAEYGIEVIRRKFDTAPVLGHESFLKEMQNYLAPFTRIDTAEFQITKIAETKTSPLTVSIDIRYHFVGMIGSAAREERIGCWQTEWSRVASNRWRAVQWNATEETVTRARLPMFLDVTSQALGRVDSFHRQMIHGVDYWRTVLDGASGIDVYGNTGLATGDFDSDGFDDLYICQPPGLPNRLYRNRGDGTFEDVTEPAGVGVLDGSACALFADFENRGLQDLLVVCASGPLLFVNQGNGTFSLKRDAFHFQNPPAGTFTHAAIADYDRDGRLDIYFCLYNYYSGLDQYHYPVPYFDARNGPPNFLFHNEGNGVFQDRTEAAGLNAENDRYSFACTWGDYNTDGWPDLYVVNDFGRNNLYRNKGDGTFAAVSDGSQANEPGAGMSACWVDFDNDGKQDIYAAGMWVAAGMRIFGDPHFHANNPEKIRALYNRHTIGNSLYRNEGDGRFQNVARQAGVEMGRWAWSTDAWDFDHDGCQDLYIANGYISGSGDRDVSSFFWRQVVAKSPSNATPSENYERGWNAINELIRSDATWNGFERNVCYLNNRDGTFSEVSGSVGLDFLDDSRAFVLADLDHDGRLEIILKNRTAPQVRILRNAMKDLGNSVAFRLRGNKSNRDAIGAAIMIEADGRQQTKLLQAGSGFLSQHSKEVFFGLGPAYGTFRATIRWPSGLTQVLEKLPANRRIEVQEGVAEFRALEFSAASAAYERPGEPFPQERLPTALETWLVQPMQAPDFSLPDLMGNTRQLSKLLGQFILLHFWSKAAAAYAEQLRLLQKEQASLTAADIQTVCINLDGPENTDAVRAHIAQEQLSLPMVVATEEVAGIYNLAFRYMFDRRRDLALPTSFLLNREGAIVKVYQGLIQPVNLLKDLRSMPKTSAELQRNALPMPGTLFLGGFQRNDFTYAVALFQRGYLQAATDAFKQVIATHPDNPEAYYNLGTLNLIRNALPDARSYLQQALYLRPEYAEAWNNMAMVSAQQGQTAEAIDAFQKALQLRPSYVTALLNFGNLLRRKGDFDEATKVLLRALEAGPENADVNYSIGMLYAQQNGLQQAAEFLQKAAALRPDYADALNNLGVVLVRQGQYPEAKTKFETCIQVAPQFDQAYLNLARLYVVLNDKDKAKEVLQALLRQQPEHKLARQTLEMLN
jgi:tetratricopeptide (TPR) repeat protein